MGLFKTASRALRPGLTPVAIAAALAVAAAAPPACAAPVIDQQQVVYDIGFTFTDGTFPQGQSFTAGMSGKLTRIDLLSNGQRTLSNDVTFEVREGDGVGGTLLGTMSLTIGPATNYADLGLYTWVDAIDLSSLNIFVSAGSQYTFLVDDNSYPYFMRGFIGSLTNPYAGGQAYFGPAYGEQPQWDLSFRTYVEEGVAQIPEPPALVLSALGLLAVARLRRR